jgi:FkbM family methyltransferase
MAKRAEASRMSLKKMLIAALSKVGIEGREELMLYLRYFPHVARVKKILKIRTSQCLQDVFAILELKAWKYKGQGYFVEFGATDGISLSNTYLLEKVFGFTGILAEPAKIWHKDLSRNRSVTTDTRCVGIETGKLIEFAEVLQPELSTAQIYMNNDHWQRDGVETKYYQVKTVSLIDLLQENHAPAFIDYLSIDTEGSELSILSAFDFSKFKFRVITVEHNFSKNRLKIKALLEENGYRRVLEKASGQDDWFILDD